MLKSNLVELREVKKRKEENSGFGSLRMTEREIDHFF